MLLFKACCCTLACSAMPHLGKRGAIESGKQSLLPVHRITEECFRWLRSVGRRWTDLVSEQYRSLGLGAPSPGCTHAQRYAAARY